MIDEVAVAAALTEYTRVWESLTIKERVRMVGAVV